MDETWINKDKTPPPADGTTFEARHGESLPALVRHWSREQQAEEGYEGDDPGFYSEPDWERVEFTHWRHAR